MASMMVVWLLISASPQKVVVTKYKDHPDREVVGKTTISNGDSVLIVKTWEASTHYEKFRNGE